MKGSKKKVIIGVVAVVVIAAGFIYYNTRQTQPTAEELMAQMQNQTVTVEKRDISQTIFTSGNIQAKNAATISAAIGGVISDIFVEEGDMVKEGQIVAEMDISDLLNQIEQKELSLEIDQNNFDLSYQQAQEAYEDALDKFVEQEALYQADAISRQEYEDAKEALESAKKDVEMDTTDGYWTSLEIKQKQLKQTQLQLDDLYQDLEDSTIFSPMSGVITDVKIKEADRVTENTLLFDVQDLNHLEVLVTAGEYDVNKLELGMHADITGEGFDGVYSGTVCNIAPVAVTSGSETIVEIVIDIDNETVELKPNFTADAEIIVASAKQVLAVPLDAVINNPKTTGQAVRVMVDGTMNMVQVETGVADDLYIEVNSVDLHEGDQVVSTTVSSNSNLPDGMKPGMGMGPGMRLGGGK